MMKSAVSGYAYLNTRVSLMAEQLLHREQRDALLTLPYSGMKPLLLQAGLKELAEELPEHSAALEQHLASRLVDESIKLLRCMNSDERRFIAHWMRRLELINLKLILRSIFSGSGQIYPETDLLDLGKLTSLDQQALIGTDSVEEFLRQLKNSRYGKMASSARKVFEEHRSLFDVEAILDTNYYAQLVQLATNLEGEHREQTTLLLRTWLDQVNLVSLLRFRFVYKLTPPHAYFLLAPAGRQLSLASLQQIAQQTSVEDTMQQLPASLHREIDHSDNIEEIEQQMQQRVRVQANKILRKQRFNMARAYAYLYLREQQIQLIHSVLKGHILGLKSELIQFCGDPLSHQSLALREGS